MGCAWADDVLTWQVLVATSTLAWGVNTPAHLVIIKGTEFFDAPTRSAPRCSRSLQAGGAASFSQVHAQHNSL